MDNQSTTDIFCNKDYVTDIKQTPQRLRLKSNGGTLYTRSKASVNGYHRRAWHSKKAITIVISYVNLGVQYLITSNIREKKFGVHREDHGLPNLVFRQHKTGLHYYDPSEDYTFVETVEDNKKKFTKRQVAGAEKASSLCESLMYPSDKDFKWIVLSNLTKNCLVRVQDVVVGHKTWGKDINYHGYLTADILLSRIICFSTVEHLAHTKIEDIFRAFKIVFKLCMQRSFR